MDMRERLAVAWCRRLRCNWHNLSDEGKASITSDIAAILDELANPTPEMVEVSARAYSEGLLRLHPSARGYDFLCEDEREIALGLSRDALTAAIKRAKGAE